VISWGSAAREAEVRGERGGRRGRRGGKDDEADARGGGPSDEGATSAKSGRDEVERVETAGRGEDHCRMGKGRQRGATVSRREDRGGEGAHDARHRVDLELLALHARRPCELEVDVQIALME